MYYTLILVTLLLPFKASAQADTLNQYNAEGERTGWWLVYLDEQLKEVKDSSKATHLKYTIYKGKFDYYNMGTIGSKKSPVIFPESDTLLVNGLKLLNGEYRSNHKNGQTQFILVAKNGVFVDYKEFYPNGQLKTHFDYTEVCGEKPYQWCIYMYEKDGALKYKGYSR